MFRAYKSSIVTLQSATLATAELIVKLSDDFKWLSLILWSIFTGLRSLPLLRLIVRGDLCEVDVRAGLKLAILFLIGRSLNYGRLQ